jgi:hypothetical protein
MYENRKLKMNIPGRSEAHPSAGRSDPLSEIVAYDTAPRFVRFLHANSSLISLLAGSAKYWLAGNTGGATSESPLKTCLIELQIPTERERMKFHPSRMAVYADESRTELVDVVIVGCPGNRSQARVEVSRTGTIPSEMDTLNIGGSCFRFRLKQEADLWRVAIDDVLGADAIRWNELVDVESPNPPRGYRGHLSRLREAIQAPPPAKSESNNIELLRDCLWCIDYMKKRLDKCKCSASVDLQTEDLLYETRLQLIKRLT